MATLAIRDALPRDAFVVTQVLGAAFAGSAVGRWLDPDPKTRRLSAGGHILGLAAEAIKVGIARVAEAYLGVRPDRQGRGIGGCLLVSHHALLHLCRTPVFLLAGDGRSRELFERHRYVSTGPPRMLVDGVPVWAMRRPPVPADPL